MNPDDLPQNRIREIGRRELVVYFDSSHSLGLVNKTCGNVSISLFVGIPMDVIDISSSLMIEGV